MSNTSCTASDPRFRSLVPVGKAKPGGGSLSAAVAVVLGLALTLTAAFLVAKWEGRVARQEFTAVSENHLLILQNGWNEYLSKLVALRAMFESSDAVTRVEFELFTRRMLRGLNAIQNFNWVPRVLNAERAAHERAAQHDGIPAYRIRYAPSHGTIVPSPERDEYLPVFYTTLPKTNRLYGLDLRSTIADKLDRARDLDELSCVPNWVLHSTDGATRGILLSLPVYRQGHVNQTVDDRRRSLAGFVHGAFLIREMMAEILAANTTPQGIDIYLFAADAGGTDAPLYVHASRLRSDAADLATKAAVEAEMHWTGDIKLGDARWTVMTVPISPGPFIATHGRAWIVLGAGLAVTLLLAAYTLASDRHARRLMAVNRQVAQLARRDPLTGLANRRFFFEQLGAAFANGGNGRLPFAVLYFDLDHFKDINDTLGHPLGDRLLRRVAERVKEVVQDVDVVARFGGDEFAVLHNGGGDVEAAKALAAKIAQLVARPYAIDGNEIHVTASIGIALSSAETADPDTIMIQADLALYRAKREGRNCFHLHSPDLDRQVHERVAIADELRLAIGRGELELYYQPQVEIATGRIIGLEALLRWNHPRRGMVLPSTFIPIAEKTGLILALGQWAFEQACRQLRTWLDQDVAPGVLAVNFSAAQFRFDGEFEGDVRDSLTRWRIPAGVMEMELTESVLMEVTEQHQATLERLRGFGLRVAIDDFGTGYSSLNYLTFYPVNRLKIAQELVFRVTTDSRNATVVRASVRLADELDVEFIAEGVEDAAQAHFLVSAGCRYAQGYYFGRPVDAAATTALLRRGTVHPERETPRVAEVSAA